VREAAAHHAASRLQPYIFAGRAMRSYSSGSTYATCGGSNRRRPADPARSGTRLTAAPSRQASEPNTLHALFASLCGMRPHLGMDKPEYSDKQRLARCLPAELRAAGIHSAFYTTSNVGLQKELGYKEVWSSVEDYTVGDWRSSAEDQRKYPGERIGNRDPNPNLFPWPPQWWRNTTAELLRGRTAGLYNWLGDHDFFGLPKARDILCPGFCVAPPGLCACPPLRTTASAVALRGRCAISSRRRASAGSSYTCSPSAHTSRTGTQAVLERPRWKGAHLCRRARRRLLRWHASL